MKAVLGLAAPFLDRIANPVYGLEENEAQAARFGDLMARDPELRDHLTKVELDEHDVDLLPTTAWLWYLAWRRAQQVGLPRESFMDALFDHTSDAIVRLRVLEAAVTDPVVVARFADFRERGPRALDKLPRFWLRERLISLVRPQERLRESREEDHAAYGESLELAAMMLQIGNDVAQTCLRVFLAHPWGNQKPLHEVVGEMLRLSTAGDERALNSWSKKLGLYG